MKRINIVMGVLALISEFLSFGFRDNRKGLLNYSNTRHQIEEMIDSHRQLKDFSFFESNRLGWDDGLVYSVSRSDLEMNATIYTREIGNAFDYLVVIDYLWLINPNSDRDQFYIGYDPSVLNTVGFSFIQRQCVSRFIGQDSLYSTKCTQSDRLENVSMGLMSWGIDYKDQSNRLVYRETVHWGLASFILRTSKRIDDGDVLFAFQFIDNNQLLPHDSVVFDVVENDEHQLPIAKVIPSDRQRYLSGFYK